MFKAMLKTILHKPTTEKKCKYTDVIQECQEAGWEVKYFPIEVGSREFTNQTLRACFKYWTYPTKRSERQQMKFLKQPYGPPTQSGYQDTTRCLADGN